MISTISLLGIESTKEAQMLTLFTDHFRSIMGTNTFLGVHLDLSSFMDTQI